MTQLLTQRRTLDRLRDAGAINREEYDEAIADLAETIEDAELAEEAPQKGGQSRVTPDWRPPAMAALGVAALLWVTGNPLSFAIPLGLAAAVGVLTARDV